MSTRCPHCDRVNVLAGYYRPDNVEGRSSDIKVFCGFCGERFVPMPASQQPVPVERNQDHDSRQ